MLAPPVTRPSPSIEYIHTPDRYEEVLQTMLAAGDAPDVYKLGGYYPDLAARGALMDITENVANDPVLGYSVVEAQAANQNPSFAFQFWHHIFSRYHL